MARLLCLFRKARLAWLPAAMLISAVPAAAQTVEQEPPAHISLAEGTVILERDGRTDNAPGSMPLLAGDRLRTQNGRAEILFADGSTLHLDANTVVDFQSDEVIRLLQGRVRANISGPTRPVSYRIDAPSAWVQITQPGEYRVALVDGERAREVELAVLRGAAELVNEDGTTRVRAGERAFAAAGLAPSQPYVFNSAAWDAFDQWSENRRSQRLGVSAEYVPDAVQSYATVFNDYGSWRQEPTYGYVWYPRVTVGWRPYYYGRWSHLRPFGWTWIGHDPWAWPTHHYGRWGFSSGAWFWIPGRHWSPAWVSWAYAPGYVSWCPLGWNNRPVFGFFNVHRGHRYNPWHGWTVVPHRRFGSGFVNVNVVNVDRLDLRTRNGFAIRDNSPDVRGYAVPRSQTPIRVAGSRSGYAVPRGGAAAPGTADRESFRNRGSSGAPLNGPGFPAPAREPRTSAVPRSADRSTPGPGAAAVPERSSPSRRAVPQAERAPSAPIRRSPGGVDAPRPGSGQAPRPGSVQAPRQGSGQAPVRRSPDNVSPPASPSPERSRAVPRRSGGYSAPSVSDRNRGGEASVPSPRIERYQPAPRRNDAPAYEPDRGVRRAPEQPQYGGSRSVPRSAGRESPGVQGYGSDRGMNRPSSVDRPSGPPPSAAPPPSRRSAEPPPSQGAGRPSAAPAPRSRGGQPASGGAVRRGGRG